MQAVADVLAALLERERTGKGSHVVVSMTHGAHRLVAHRLAGEPVDRILTGGLACYRVYATADGRWLTVAALEHRFFERLCELIERPRLLALQYDPSAQDAVAAELAEAFAARALDDWLALFDGEDVAVGPVATLEEAAASFGEDLPTASAPRLGADTDAWRRELGL